MHHPDSHRALTGADVPPALRALVDNVATRLVAGTTPTHRTLQRQLARAADLQGVLTGSGCFADFPCPTDAPLVAPAPVSDGCAHLALFDGNNGADALIHVRDSRLTCLELHTKGGEPWSESSVLLSMRDVDPIAGGERGRTSEESRKFVARPDHLTLR